MVNFLLYMLLFIPAAALQGWCLSLMWLWFIVPLGVKPLTVWWAVGVSLTIQLFKPTTTFTNDQNDYPLWAKELFIVAMCLIGLGMGWIVHYMMR